MERLRSWLHRMSPSYMLPCTLPGEGYVFIRRWDYWTGRFPGARRVVLALLLTAALAPALADEAPKPQCISAEEAAEKIAGKANLVVVRGELAEKFIAYVRENEIAAVPDGATYVAVVEIPGREHVLILFGVGPNLCNAILAPAQIGAALMGRRA